MAAPPHSRHRQDVMQAFYRLLAVALICVVLGVVQRRLPDHEQHPQRAAANGAAVPDGLRPHPGHPHRRPRPLDRRECRAVRMPGRERDQAHRLALARGGDRHRLRRHDRACQRHPGDGAAHPVVHRHLRHDVDRSPASLIIIWPAKPFTASRRVPPPRQRLSVRRADAGLRHGAVPSDRRTFRASARSGASRSTPSAPIRSPRASPACRSNGAWCWSTP